MPIVCKILEHKPKISEFSYEFGDASYSCHRCHCFIDYHPVIEGLDESDTKLVKFIEGETGQKVTVKFDNIGISLSWTQFGCDGRDSNEAFKIKILKKTIRNYLGWRLLEFYYNGFNKETVYFRFKNDPEKENLLKEMKDKIMSEVKPESKAIKIKNKDYSPKPKNR